MSTVDEGEMTADKIRRAEKECHVFGGYWHSEAGRIARQSMATEHLMSGPRRAMIAAGKEDAS
jgi:hypothetical protein